jgi:hypothetical protein
MYSFGGILRIPWKAYYHLFCEVAELASANLTALERSAINFKSVAISLRITINFDCHKACFSARRPASGGTWHHEVVIVDV